MFVHVLFVCSFVCFLLLHCFRVQKIASATKGPDYDGWVPEIVDADALATAEALFDPGRSANSHGLSSLSSKKKKAKKEYRIMQRLTDLFGNTEVFVEDYKNLLAERLMTAASYDVDHEVGKGK